MAGYPNKHLNSRANYLHVPGGTLGLCCHHAYAHNKPDYAERLPYALKGVDAIFYSVFNHLGLKVKIRAVIDNPNNDRYRSYNSDDCRNDAELVSTRLHGMKLTEDGGDEDGADTADVCRNDTNFLFGNPNS